jgi:hypothetical protein
MLRRLAMLDLEHRTPGGPGDDARGRLPAVEVAEVPAAAVDVDERDVTHIDGRSP